MNKKGKDSPYFINRVGEKFTTNQGFNIEIVECLNDKNMTIRFDDGTLKSNLIYGNIKRGSVNKDENRIGFKSISKSSNQNMIIIEYINSKNITIEFEDGTIVKNVEYRHFKEGSVRNPYYPSVCGVGYLGQGKYKSSVNREHTYSYKVWMDMLARCYSEKTLTKHPSYKGVTVCEEWKCFQNFGAWCEENLKPYMKGWELDKDILFKGNKIYSPDTCDFVPNEINIIFKLNKNNRGALPIGATRHGNSYQSYVSINSIQLLIGTYSTPEQAFQAYKVAKEKYIKEKADEWKGRIKNRIYEAMYNWVIEIND